MRDSIESRHSFIANTVNVANTIYIICSLVAVVVDLVVGGESTKTAVAEAEGEEHLPGCIVPHLQREQKLTLMLLTVELFSLFSGVSSDIRVNIGK